MIERDLEKKLCETLLMPTLTDNRIHKVRLYENSPRHMFEHRCGNAQVRTFLLFFWGGFPFIKLFSTRITKYDIFSCTLHLCRRSCPLKTVTAELLRAAHLRTIFTAA